jgi:hypothetical protein
MTANLRKLDGGALPPPWQPCPQGELGRLRCRLRRRRQRRRLLHGALSLSIALSAGSAGLVWRLRDMPSPEYDFAGLRCTEVQRLAMGPLSALDPALAERVRRHVGQCPRCGPLLVEMEMTM